MPSLTLERGQFRQVPGRNYDTPKEVWGFELPAMRGPVEDAARRVLEANTDLLGLTGIHDRLACRRVIESAGAVHAIFSQRHHRLHVHRAYVTVHMTRDRAAYLIKNRAVPRDLLPDGRGFRLSAGEARRVAMRSVRRRVGEFTLHGAIERLWFPLRKRLRPAFKLRLISRRPRREIIVYVDADSGAILSKYDNLAKAGFARVFDPNPIVTLGDATQLLDGDEFLPPPESVYRRVRLSGLNRSGRLDGRRVSTRLTPQRVQRRSGRFEFTNRERGFDEAMVYYHVDAAIAYLESLGYRNGRAIFRAPIVANVRGTRDDNAWYSPGLRTLTFGTGGVPAAHDGETIVHELGHAVQDAICPDFGQSTEAAAMGEGFGDYFAGSFFAAQKIAAGHRHLLPTVMSWDGVQDPVSEPPPCVRRLDCRLTYESFNHRPTADEHDNGQIWAATLWDVRTATGRDVADRVIVESHFQLDGFTTFARAARAILDADRNLFGGSHVRALARVFHRRGIGPVE
jgi:hypothetical protein